ncbi:MAG TPA: TetR/AcrR family transcriptional regulator [Acidimicrobiales bacterium]|nr:TetR/AcrR family transcriptional regulator [Acidimicrobiales bacterium]
MSPPAPVTAIAGAAPPATKRRPGRPPADASPATRDEILLAALDAFAALGYDGTSVREICQRLGVSHNLIHQRFGTKRGLWDAMVDRWFAELAAGLDAVLDDLGPGDDLVAGLHRFVVTFVELNAARPELLRLMNVEAGLDTDRLDHIWTRYVEPFSRRFGRLMQRAVDGGLVRPLPLGTFFTLLAHGSTALAAHPPLARRLGVPDPHEPHALRAHAEAVAAILLAPPDSGSHGTP